MQTHIKNIFGENLDLLIEGNENAENIVIFVHGYGTDKNEGFSSFLDLSTYLQKDFLLLRFDLSGYGKSEGSDDEFQFQKAAGDTDSVIRYARKKYPNKNINIIAHSLGTFVVSLLSPYEIRKIIFTSIPNSNVEFISKQLENRILAHGGEVNKNGVTVYKRTSGAVQKIGKDFWRTLESFKPLDYIADLGNKTQLTIYKPLQDEVLKNKYFEEYTSLKNVKYIEVNGDHNFKLPEDREGLFAKIKQDLLSKNE